MKKIILILFISIISLNAQDDLIKHQVNAVGWFKHSAEMELCYLQTYKYAEIMLDKWINAEIVGLPPAIVLDIDETVLDNSPYQASIIANNKPYNSSDWKKWTAKAEARVLPGVKDFLNKAKIYKMEIFYISNREIDEMDATVANLKKHNLPNADPKYILLKHSTSDKTFRRSEIVKNYDVVLFVGDNLTDFSEIFANRKGTGKELVYENIQQLLGKFIMLPNPMYGEWEKALYNNDYSQPDSIKSRIKIENILKNTEQK